MIALPRIGELCHVTYIQNTHTHTHIRAHFTLVMLHLYFLFSLKLVY